MLCGTLKFKKNKELTKNFDIYTDLQSKLVISQLPVVSWI